mmetsp:Transcript_16500/g.50540  ORF Transcript_16500/g.50540 Transcript_16500/m.50540 type:complete len:88 (-) Transcript_16500:330-593(-)
MTTYNFRQTERATASFNSARSTLSDHQSRLEWEEQIRYRSAKWNRMTLDQKKKFRKAPLPRAGSSVGLYLLAVPAAAGAYYYATSLS